MVSEQPAAETSLRQRLAGPIPALAISPGVAVGPVRIFNQPPPKLEALSYITPDRAEVEQQRLGEAVAAVAVELGRLADQVARTVGPEEAGIFEAQQLMIQDPDLLAQAHHLIAVQHFSAASALKQATEEQARRLETLGDAYLAARSADLRDAANRAERFLAGEPALSNHYHAESEPVVLVAYDLTPSDTASLNPKAILGICTVVGGPTTHAAILARALEIPAIAGIDWHIIKGLSQTQQIAIDGSQGLLYLELDSEQRQELSLKMHRQQQERITRRVQNERQWRGKAGVTADGHAVQIFANVGDIEGALQAGELGAEGIGLLRTEFLFGNRTVFPDEAEQFESYLNLFRAFGSTARLGKTIVARTLDAGADKPFPALESLIGPLNETNPALGLRGVRIHLAYPELLRQQLRALLRAAATSGAELHIMFPMITTLEEVWQLRTIYNGVRQELENEGVRLSPQTRFGIMVETPAAVLMAETLAREVDFLSIGANDLFQYTLAADRTNSRVMSRFSQLEPAVWRSIAQVVRAGVVQGKPVAVCGEIAADPRIGPLLAGLGVHELSVSPPAILNLKSALNEHSLEYWQQEAHKLLTAETAADMQF
jgi:phosphoenolpyruvate-protein phosphotransferase